MYMIRTKRILASFAGVNVAGGEHCQLTHQTKQPRKQRVPHQERVSEPLQSLLLPKLRVVN